MSNLNTQNPNNYIYKTKYLKIQILGGIRFNNLEAMRVTLGIQKVEKEQVLRQNIDLYNDPATARILSCGSFYIKFSRFTTITPLP